MGKTSITSRFNLPGKLGWSTMEAPGFLIVLYIMSTLPSELHLKSVPTENWIMAALFSIHYVYRALISPWFLNPSISPIHVLVWSFAFTFQVFNGLSIGGWLAGYGPRTSASYPSARVYLGIAIWSVGLLGNFYYESRLWSMRKEKAAQQAEKDKGKPGNGKTEKVYVLPSGGLFDYVLYPHYLCEWIEWTGYWVVGGWRCPPARQFAINSISNMMPSTLRGRRWYVGKFGKEKVGSRKAVIPGLI